MLGTEKLVVKLSQSIVPREDTSQHTRQMCRRYLHKLSIVHCAKEGAVGCGGGKEKICPRGVEEGLTNQKQGKRRKGKSGLH